MNDERIFEADGAVSRLEEQLHASIVAWEPVAIRFRTRHSRAWWKSPVRVLFRHVESGVQITVEGFRAGDDICLIRFAAPRPGRWRYTTQSDDPALLGLSGELDVRPASAGELETNPNLRGHVRIAAGGRRFEYADGSPVFLLADTIWAVNTARCGLGKGRDGPFYEYLRDRKRKGFNTILMAYMRGFGDTTTEPAGQRNEGGYPFVDGNPAHLNFAYFDMLDRRARALWANGFIVAAHPTWFGKRNCFFTLEQAKRISVYLAVRYGAYNGVWSLSGEYQYAMRDCGWTDEQISELGEAVQRHNAYRRPVSIHPSSRTDWPAPHHRQSSRAFAESTWLDHIWLQTGQKPGTLFRVPERILENRRLSPAMPVFLAEGCYERATDPDHAYHSRWQVWTAFLSAAAGYGYGAYGVWQFYDPTDANSECGNHTEDTVPWREALQLQGSRQMGVFQNVISTLPWWELEPQSESLMIDGRPASAPTGEDSSPPCCAVSRSGLCIVYVPRGNARRVIRLCGLKKQPRAACWYDPRTGKRIALGDSPPVGQRWTIPHRPDPDEDWVLVATPCR